MNYICQLKLITKQDEPCTIAFADIMNYLQAYNCRLPNVAQISFDIGDVYNIATALVSELTKISISFPHN